MTDSSGQRVRGKLTALSSDALSILTDGRTLTFKEQQVREVQQRLADSKVEGGVIGLLAGWLPAAIYCSVGSDSSETAGCWVGTFVWGGRPGLAIGMVIDGLQAKTVTVFRSPASARVLVAPVITPHGLQVRASVQFHR